MRRYPLNGRETRQNLREGLGASRDAFLLHRGDERGDEVVREFPEEFHHVAPVDGVLLGFVVYRLVEHRAFQAFLYRREFEVEQFPLATAF